MGMQDIFSAAYLNLECIFKFYFFFSQIELSLTEIPFCSIMSPNDPYS